MTASIGPLSDVSNSEAELVALILAIQTFRKRQIENPTLHTLSIFSDSQSAINALHKPLECKSNQYIVRHLKTLIEDLNQETKIKLFWVPGHESIQLNEIADEKAKQATEYEEVDIHLNTNLSSLKRIVKSSLKPGAESLITNKPFIFRTPPIKIWKALANLEKGRVSIIFQLRSGHIALNAYLFKHANKSVSSPNCSKCNVPETVDHFLVRCKRFHRQRQIFRQTLKEENIKINPFNSKKLIDRPEIFFHLSNFVLQTERFHHFRSYLDDSDV